MIDRDLRKEMVEEKCYLRSSRSVRAIGYSTHLLPAFDEYNVAYKAREMIVDRRASVDTWSLLGPTIIVDGRAVGSWKREGTRTSMIITLNMSNGLKKFENLAIRAAAERYAAFLGVSSQIQLTH